LTATVAPDFCLYASTNAWMALFGTGSDRPEPSDVVFAVRGWRRGAAATGGEQRRGGERGGGTADPLEQGAPVGPAVGGESGRCGRFAVPW